MSDCDCKKDTNSQCPNYIGCKITSFTDFIPNEKIRELYLKNYCESNWVNCKRFMIKNELSFCPDFVLPDTELSTKEIMEKFDSD